ncbi:MAG: hypothetical protein HQK53_15815 [Oligoflexia bacterium]|nr:hypothetical protein [Oligoflexia bacterium]
MGQRQKTRIIDFTEQENESEAINAPIIYVKEPDNNKNQYSSEDATTFISTDSANGTAEESNDNISETPETPDEDEKIYIYSFSHQQTFPLQLHTVVGNKTNKKNDDYVHDVYCEFLYRNNTYEIVAMQGHTRIDLNKKAMEILKEYPVGIGDYFDIGSHRYVLVDRNDLSEEDAKRYIGQKLLSSKGERGSTLEGIEKELPQLLANMKSKQNELQNAIKHYQYLEKIRSEIKHLEALNLPQRIKELEIEYLNTKELYEEKEKRKQVLTSRMAEQKTKQQQAIIEQKSMLEKQIKDLMKKQKELEKKTGIKK